MVEKGRYIPQEAKPAKERMTDAEIGDLLAACGNHEGKALLLIAMQPEEPYTRRQLRELIRAGQAGQESWRGMGQTLPFYWCEQSLSPIGLVAREIIDPEKGTVGYMKTPKGEEEGVALAGHLLEYSENHPDISLIQLFGSTQSKSRRHLEGEYGEEAGGKLRSPLMRLRIFSELATGESSQREKDLVQALTNDYDVIWSHNIVGDYLTGLARLDIITYEAINPNKAYTFYTPSVIMPDTNPPKFSYFPSLAREVFSVFRDIESPVSAEDVREALIAKFPSKKEQLALRRNVSKVLKHLAKEGYAEKAGEFSNEQQSKISISDIQRESLIELVEIIEKFREHDSEFIEEGKRKASAIAHDPQRFARLLRKAEQASPYANLKDLSESVAQLKCIIMAHPGISRAELQEAFSAKYGRWLKNENINQILRTMQERKNIEVVKKGNVKYYSILQEESVEPVIFESPQVSFSQSGTVFEAK